MSRPARNIYDVTALPAREKSETGWMQGSLRQWVSDHFEFPSGEFAIVTDNGQKLSLPYPLIAAFLALFVWIAGGTLAGVWALATISTNVANLTSTLDRDNATAIAERKAMQERIELQGLLISDLREKVIRLEARKGN